MNSSKIIGLGFMLVGVLILIRTWVSGTIHLGTETGTGLLIIIAGLSVLFQSQRNPPFSDNSMTTSAIISAIILLIIVIVVQIMLSI